MSEDPNTVDGMQQLRRMLLGCGIPGARIEPEAVKIYARIRREVFHELAVSDDDGFLELASLGNTGDQAGDPVYTPEEIDALWHKIRSNALGSASEMLSWHGERAGHPKVRWTLDWAARKIHHMIIDPEGSRKELTHGQAQGTGITDGAGTAPDAGAESGAGGRVRPDVPGTDGDGTPAAPDPAGPGD